jgi:hypothetical protein
MTIHVHQNRNSNWVIGRNLRETDDAGRFGNSLSRRFDFDGFWSGTKWVKAMANAVRFANEPAASQYIDSNYAQLDG